MATSAPEKVTVRRLEGWRRHDRVIAAAIGAVLVVLAYVAVTSVYRYTDTYQQAQYDEGYDFGRVGGIGISACTATAERLYDSTQHHEPGGPYDRSGAQAFEAGCWDAVNRLPRWTDYQLGSYQPTPGDPDYGEDTHSG